MTMRDINRIAILMRGYQRHLRDAARQQRRLLAAVQATGDAQLEVDTLNELALALAAFHAEHARALLADGPEQQGADAGKETDAETGDAA